jgi:pimeloyl-ACP methyl ester carboxylesterase
MSTKVVLITGSVLVEIDKAGHMLQIEQPEAFNQAVRDYLNARR